MAKQWQLASLDLPDDRHRLRAEALRSLAAAGGANYRVPDQFEGRDPAGVVWIVLSREGDPIDLGINGEWRQHVDARELGAAIHAAYRDALRQIVDAIALESMAREATAEQHRAPVGADAARAGTTLPPRLPEREWLAQTWDKLHAVSDKLHRLNTPSGAEPATRTVSSPAGAFRFTCHNGQVTALVSDPDRIQHSDQRGGLAADALAGFRMAREQQPE